MKKSHLLELEFQFPSEEAEMPKNANEIIKDYIRNVGSEGITMDEVMEEVKYLPHAFQLRLMMELVNRELLVIRNKSEEEYDDDDTMDELPPIKINMKQFLKMWNSKFDIAWDAARNMYDFNMNENKIDYYKDRHGKKFQTVDVNYLQYPGKVMVKYTDSDTPVEYTGNFEADLKSNMIKRLDSEINEAFFIGEGKTIECGKCGWRWDLEDGGKDPYLCKCGYDNSYKYNDEIDEYDVDENNPYEIKEFIQFMKEYKQYLSEAQCDCVYEAKYHGREVSLGKPMQGDIKKFKVYVKNNKGKVVKVNFGAHGMNIKRNNPKRRNAYRKRHHCDQPGPRWKANYWSCRKW